MKDRSVENATRRVVATLLRDVLLFLFCAGAVGLCLWAFWTFTHTF